MKDKDLRDYLEEYIKQSDLDVDKIIDTVEFAREYDPIFEYRKKYYDLYQEALDYANGWIQGSER